MNGHGRRCALVAALTVCLGGAAVQAQDRDFTPVTDAMLENPDPADWLSWRRTLDGWGHSPLDQITTDNAHRLQLAWSWGVAPGSQQTTPLVHDGVMYIANPGEIVQALDAVTGELLWEYRRDAQASAGGSGARPAGGRHRNIAIYQDKIYLNSTDAHIVAIDARTGVEVWDTDVGGGVGYQYSSGSIVADGKVISGLTGCGLYRDDTCYIVGLDAETGGELWRTSTIARPGERGGDTWGDLPVMFRAGSDSWIPGSYDPITRTLFHGTSQAKPWARAARGTDGDALYTNSTLALDPDTGAMKWYYQHLPGETLDMDEVFERILVDYDGRRSVFSMGKIAVLWELDLETGGFRSAKDLGYQTVADIDPASGQVTYREGTNPVLGEETFWCPSTSGFKSWRAMSYHPATEAFYIPIILNCETGVFGPVEQREGGGGAGAGPSHQPLPPGQSGPVGRVPRDEHADRRGPVAAPVPDADQQRRVDHRRRARSRRRLGPPPVRLRRGRRRDPVADADADLGPGLPDLLRGRRQAVSRGAGRHRRRQLDEPDPAATHAGEAASRGGQRHLRLRAARTGRYAVRWSTMCIFPS